MTMTASETEIDNRTPVSERALAARVDRKLRQQGSMLRRCPPSSRWHYDLGYYYTIDIRRNAIESRHIDIEDWGRELGCLKPWERLVDEG
jgi:hypothetical protein